MHVASCYVHVLSVGIHEYALCMYIDIVYACACVVIDSACICKDSVCSISSFNFYTIFVLKLSPSVFTFYHAFCVTAGSSYQSTMLIAITLNTSGILKLPKQL